MTWVEHHKVSEKFASQAQVAAWEGRHTEALSLYADAADAESKALADLDTSKARTVGITAVSAAALYYKAKDFAQAEEIAGRWLGFSSLPAFAKEQLRSLQQSIWLRSEDSMNKTKAKRMFENARREINKAQESSVEAMDATQAEYRWGALSPVYEPLDFDAVGASQFLGEYCYAVFTSGFRTAIVAQHAQAIAKAFKNFDLDALARTDSIDLAVVPIKNERKVKSFLKGAKAIASEGFEAFKARLKEGGMDVLGELPWMGRANRQHLAMIIGLADTAKDDVWLRRCAKECEFPSVGAFVFFLAREYGLSQRGVDAFLWDYCRRHQDVPPTD